MLQSTARAQTEKQGNDQSRNGYMQSLQTYSKDAPRMPSGDEHPSSTWHRDKKASLEMASSPSFTSTARQKTMYKLVDTDSGLFCQGGAWPCMWDSAGKTWASRSALRRFLRSVLARGYHLKPRAVPPQWKIIEIEEVISYHEKSHFSADILISSR